SFTGSRLNNYTQLEWITVNEVNVARFTIERSNNNSAFYPVISMPARNSGNRETYTARDYASIQNTAWYRLRTTDADGKEKLSPVISVRQNDLSPALKLAFNPVSEKIALVANNNIKGQFGYHILSANGQLMQAGNFEIQQAGQYELPLKYKLPTGIYFLTIQSEQETFTYKVIVL
ncbi:MAG TPA: T9SS type A sorting domain-containing protein, partial [Chitinophagaceae bacterium]|nr:T9SS type A sorting domain-containing protein [Chitinophagaceae bacterium]